MEGGIGWFDGLAVASNAPNSSGAHEFINYMVDPTFYVEWATKVGAPASANIKANEALPADDVGRQIKGFASATSINVGESIDFHVSVRPVQGFKVKVYRLGRSSTGKGSELIFTSPRISGTAQAPAKVVEPTRTVVAPWKLSYRGGT